MINDFLLVLLIRDLLSEMHDDKEHDELSSDSCKVCEEFISSKSSLTLDQLNGLEEEDSAFEKVISLQNSIETIASMPQASASFYQEALASVFMGATPQQLAQIIDAKFEPEPESKICKCPPGRSIGEFYTEHGVYCATCGKPLEEPEEEE